MHMTMKRRWLIARPWVKDIGAGIGLVIFIIAAFWGMGPFVALIAAVLWPDQ